MIQFRRNIYFLLFALVSLSGFAEEKKEAAKPAPKKAEKSYTFDEHWKKVMTPIAGESDFLKALLLGKAQFSFRLGYEHSNFDDPGDLDPAEGFNLQTRFTYKSGEFNGISFLIQPQFTTNFVEDFRWPSGGDPAHDVIADPDKTRIHQGYFDLTFIPDTVIRAGIQEILLDDVRFIGNVGWRQGAQSFTAVTVTNKSIENLKLFAGYVDRIHNIFYQDLEDEELILLNAAYTYAETHNISAFAYLRDGTVDAQDSATYGIRGWGSEGMFLYDATLATQTDYRDGDHDAFYYSVFGAVKFEKLQVGLGYSVISGGSDAEDRFSTLFGTAHKFNGWADQFLGTGGGLPGGLEDFWIELKSAKLPWGITGALQYHIFTAEDSSAVGGADDYGTEFDIVFSKKLSNNVTALIKYAHYDSEDFGQDEDVFWLRAMIKF